MILILKFQFICAMLLIKNQLNILHIGQFYVNIQLDLKQSKNSKIKTMNIINQMDGWSRRARLLALIKRYISISIILLKLLMVGIGEN